MKRQVRSSIFETNSSSVHSIVIGNNGDDVHTMLRRVVNFAYPKPLSYSHELFKDVGHKANYLFACIMHSDDPNKYKDAIKTILSKWNIEPRFEEKTKDEWDNRHDYWSEFDLSEYKLLLDELCESEEKLMNYLFSDASYLEVYDTDGGEESYEETDPQLTPKNVMKRWKVHQ